MADKIGKIKPGELKKKLADHKRWVDSGGKESIKANLCRKDMSGEDFSGKVLSGVLFCESILKRADFSKADLIKADLSEADLTSANLSGAILARADLRGATLINADLRGADLRHAKVDEADLRGARRGGAKLIGVDLSKAILKDSDSRLKSQKGKGKEDGVKPGETPKIMSYTEEGKRRIKVIDKASTLTRKIFIPLQSLCVLVFISSLINPTKKEGEIRRVINLPGIDAEITLDSFYFWVPILLLSVFFYFQLNLVRIWDRAILTADVDEDGVSRSEWLDPWLILGLVSLFSKEPKEKDKVKKDKGNDEEEEKNKTNNNYLQNWTAFFLAYLSVPCTFVFLWQHCLNPCNWKVTVIHLVCLALSVGISGIFIGLAVSRLSGKIAVKRIYLWGLLPALGVGIF